MKKISDMNLAEVTLAILKAAVNIPDGMYARAQFLANQELRALLDKAEADIPASVPQGEPVALTELRQIFDSNKGADGTLVISKRLAAQLLSEQPAPVAVVMPERMPTGNNVEGEHNRLSPGVREGWNACLDELKQLNTKPTCCGSCPGGCAIQAASK